MKGNRQSLANLKLKLKSTDFLKLITFQIHASQTYLNLSKSHACRLDVFPGPNLLGTHCQPILCCQVSVSCLVTWIRTWISSHQISNDHWKNLVTKAFAPLIVWQQPFSLSMSRQELNHVYLDLLRLVYVVKSGRDFIHSELLYHTLDMFPRCYNP